MTGLSYLYNVNPPPPFTAYMYNVAQPLWPAQPDLVGSEPLEANNRWFWYCSIPAFRLRSYKVGLYWFIQLVQVISQATIRKNNDQMSRII